MRRYGDSTAQFLLVVVAEDFDVTSVAIAEAERIRCIALPLLIFQRQWQRQREQLVERIGQRLVERRRTRRRSRPCVRAND
jgi:hypothetical protein